jgi:hypothetical protein
LASLPLLTPRCESGAFSIEAVGQVLDDVDDRVRLGLGARLGRSLMKVLRPPSGNLGRMVVIGQAWGA